MFAEFSGFHAVRGLDHIRIAREAVERSQPIYDPFFPMPGAVVFFGNAPASSSDAMAITNGSGDNCAVYVDDSALAGLEGGDTAANQLRRTIAHELFHCAQDKDPTLSRAVFSRLEDGWWMEGSAEYFAGLAIPEALPGSAFYDEFVARAFAGPLYTLDYDAYPFFAYLGRQRGAEAVVALLRQVEARSGERSEQTLLLSITDFDRLFNEFARAVFDGLYDESGRALPIHPPDVDVTSVSGAMRVARNVSPFTFGARRFSAEANSQYRFERPEFPGPIVAALADTPGVWRELETRFGSCRHDADAILVYTSTWRDGETQPAIFPIQSEDAIRLADCPCPIGAWTIPVANMEDFKASERHVLTNPGRSVLMIFSADGTASFTAEGVESTYNIPMPSGGTAQSIVQRDYATTWQWRVEGNQLYMIQGEMTITETIIDVRTGAPYGTIRQVSRPRRRTMGPDASSGWARRFSCDGAVLTIGRPPQRLAGAPGGDIPGDRDYPHWGVFERASH